MISILLDGRTVVCSSNVEVVIIGQNIHRFRSYYLARWIGQAMPEIALKCVYQLAGKKDVFRKIFGFHSWVEYMIFEKDEAGMIVKSSRVRVNVRRNVDIKILKHAFESNQGPVDIATQMTEKSDKNVGSGAKMLVDGQSVCHFSGDFLSGIYTFFFSRPESIHMIFRKLPTANPDSDFKSIVINAREMHVLISA